MRGETTPSRRETGRIDQGLWVDPKLGGFQSNWLFKLSDALRRDLIVATRSVRKTPAFAAVIISILALTIGVGAAAFSFVHAVVLQHLPVSEPGRLALLSYRFEGRQGNYNGYTYPAFQAIAAADRAAFQGILARGAIALDLRSETGNGRVTVEFVSPNYYDLLGVDAALGRLFRASSRELYVAVVSFRFWREHLASDPGIVGRVIRLGGQPFEVIGVTNSGFSGTVLGQPADVQVPIEAAPRFQISLERSKWLSLMGRLAPAVTWQRAEAASAAATAHAVAVVEPWAVVPRYVLEDGSRGFADARRRLAQPSVVLLAGVALLLLIACANIAGVLSARSIGRQYEMAVRVSLGARRIDLVRQTLVESALLALLGGVCGLLLARWTVLVLLRLVDDGNPFPLRIGLEMPVLAASLATSFIASLLFGALPAMQASQPNPLNQLRNGGFFSATARLRPIRFVLVAAQIALSVVLLSGAGVLARTLLNLETTDLGFEPRRVALLTLNPDSNGYSPAAAQSFVRRVATDVGRVAGVESVALSAVSPLSGNLIVFDVRAPDAPSRGTAAESATDYVHVVSERYFRVLGTSILRGRDFGPSDLPGSPAVAIVNQRLAASFWPNQNPVGRRIQADGLREVIAVVQNAHYRTVREVSPPTVYLPLSQVAADAIPPGRTILVRTHGDATALLTTMRRTVLALDPSFSIDLLQRMATQRDHTIATERTMAFLSAAFALLALPSHS